jgi:hypothetical protein|tara:strand:+ start:707 stop:856 length:150 start_codon:yes stop_codon:yes gene_type:complete
MNMEVWVREKINLVTDLHFLLVKQTNILSGQGTGSGFGDLHNLAHGPAS